MSLQVMLAHPWSESVDPTGWWMAEKLDGVRAYWNGSNFYSRTGNIFDGAPDWFKKNLPKTPLDGELWCGRGLFQKCVSIIKRKKHSKIYVEDDWKYVTYLVFDAPAEKGGYEQRVAHMRKVVKEEDPNSYAAVVGIRKCQGKAHLLGELKKVLAAGGEGLMLRKPDSPYEKVRSKNLLKVKTFFDEEALVVGSEKGEGKNLNVMGALFCKLPNGVEFKVGTGFTDADRKNPPPIGSVISFKYQELSDSGNPRFPAFLRRRLDVTWNEVCAQAKIDPPFSQRKKIIPKLKKQHTLLYSVVPSRAADGQKIVTDDDDMSEKDDSKKPAGPPGHKEVCKYGTQCFRRNAEHLERYVHEEAAVPPPAPPAKKQPCKFGAKCYLVSLDHQQNFTHDKEDKDATVSDEDLKGDGPDHEAVPAEEAADNNYEDIGAFGPPSVEARLLSLEMKFSALQDHVTQLETQLLKRLNNQEHEPKKRKLAPLDED